MDRLIQDAVLRIGEVLAVDGRKIFVQVDKNKNLSDLFFDGDIVTNISVNSYIEIRKGFLGLIGKVEGEKIEEEFAKTKKFESRDRNGIRRVLTISLAGYIGIDGVFVGGTKELPLIGNEAFLLTRGRLETVYRLASSGKPTITIGALYGESVNFELPIDGLFNSHIAIFGNTGSGKSNTLAYLYQELIKTLTDRNKGKFEDNTRFIFFDFNGEYTKPSCITPNKKVYDLSTRREAGDKLPIDYDSIINVENLSILAEATEKTQKPFLKRAINFFRFVSGDDVSDPEEYTKAILRKQVSDALQMADKNRAYLILDHLKEILPRTDENGIEIDITEDLEWHTTGGQFRWRPDAVFLQSNPDRIPEVSAYHQVDQFTFSQNFLTNVITYLYVQLISDVLTNRVQNEHIYPVINRLKSKRKDVEKVFDLSGQEDLWDRNVIVVNLDDVNLEMKKTIPLLLAKYIYSEHKGRGGDKSLNVIIDEAHNILSLDSFREAESWKDYRLETFEEIIKEGRKFGVFVTIASQRPNDISHTITSQAHNYFIHRLVNYLDLRAIATAVSYIDRVTEESIPTLPTGTCVFSGIASGMPMKLNVWELETDRQPRSVTRGFIDLVPMAEESGHP